MKDFSARDFSLIMESYKKITTAKDVTTKAPNKVSKKAILATPAKKAVPANYCKQCKDVVVKTKKLNESEDIDQSLSVLDDVEIDSNGAGDNELSAEKSVYVEKPREERKRILMDRMNKFYDDIDNNARDEFGSDDEYNKFLKYRAKIRANELDKISREFDAEEDRLERETQAWLKDQYGDENDEVDSEKAVATDVSTDDKSAKDDEDFWKKTIVLNGREMTREQARKKCNRTILQIDSKSDSVELDADDEARVVALQDAIREIRRGASEVNVDFSEATCESTIKRCSCGKGRSRKCSCGKKGAHKCSCDTNVNESGEDEDYNIEGKVLNFLSKNPQVLQKLKSGEIDAGIELDKSMFANAVANGYDTVASTNNPSYQAGRKLAYKVQDKLQKDGVLAALNYAKNGTFQGKRGKTYTVPGAAKDLFNNYKKYLDTLPKVNPPDIATAQNMGNAQALDIAGKNMDTLIKEMK